ncbi:MAG TPA: protein phosphatase 2C domain-containing protein, partial [Blastocatellia bacterium]|nr:protein phosphatase 2C domain-containing protein [Blastocatellia bacterium]
DDAACWVVADGLGGHRGGAVASRLAVDTILGSFHQNRTLSPAAISGHVFAANQAVLSRQREDSEFSQARTTVVVLVSDYRSCLWAHVGDSRLYHFRGGRLLSQTKDHSVPQAMADAGEISGDRIRYHEDRNRLLRTLGMEGELRPAASTQAVRLREDDAFLLCVDGFWEYVLETEMGVDLAKSACSGDWLTKMEARILRRAKDGHDNYTAVAVLCS